jgi:3-dehydroquinate dehydratase
MNEDSLALCLSQLKKPSVEVHYGNFFSKGKTSKVLFARPPLHTFQELPPQVSGACGGIVAGFKLRGYELAMEAVTAALRQDYSDFDYPAAAPP